MSTDLSKFNKLKNSAIINNNVAINAYEKKDYKKALSYFEKALENLNTFREELEKNSPETPTTANKLEIDASGITEKIIATLNKLGDKQYKNQNPIEAIECYKKILFYDSKNWEQCDKIAKILEEMDVYDLALDFFKESVHINPKNANAYLHIGNIYTKHLNDRRNAIPYYKKYLELEPLNANVNNTIGNLYKEINKNENVDEQIKYFKRAIELKPDFVGALRNLSIVYYLNSGYEKEAIECYQKIFKIKPIKDDYFVYSCLQIKLGNFEEGWKHYESRFEKFFEQTHYPKMNKPRWEGQPIHDKTLLVQYEQGYGDSLCFFRYLEQVKPLVKKIIFRTQDSLMELFRNSSHDIEIVGKSTPIEELSFDYHVPLMSLPLVLNARVDNIPLAEGYIKANESKVEKYKKEFFDNDCLKIGISWNGMKNGNPLRNIPLETFYPLTKMNNVKVYSFQKGFGSEQLDKKPPVFEIIDLGKTFDDFDDTAAAMANLDLFVSSDNGVFNLAASMGKKSFLMLNQNSEWRWMLDNERTPWYQSVRLFKKRDDKESWDLLMEKIIETIQTENNSSRT